MVDWVRTVHDFFESVWAFADGIPLILQFLAVFGLSLIPFIETEWSAAIGILVGVPVPLVIIASAAGPILATIVLTTLGVKASDRLTKSARAEKALARSERYGIPVAMLLGSLTFSTPITALILTTVGLSPKAS